MDTKRRRRRRNDHVSYSLLFLPKCGHLGKNNKE
jgi:hypothetical protein